MKLPKNPWWWTPWREVPKPILKAHRTHTTSTTENAMNASIMLLIDQRFCITPPYSTASPGTLIKPTSVAAVNCHEVSPEFSHDGASTGNGAPSIELTAAARPERRIGPSQPNLDGKLCPVGRCDHIPESSVHPRSLDIGINGPRI